MEELGIALEQDKRHMETMNSLWKQANKAAFAGNWKDRLLSTYMSRARALMPAIRERIRKAAQEGQEETNRQTERVATRSSDRKEVGGRAPNDAGRGTKPVAAKDVDWGKTSDEDFLNDRVTLRKK